MLNAQCSMLQPMVVASGNGGVKECGSIKQLHQLHSHSIVSGLLLLSPLSISRFLSDLLYSFTALLPSSSASSALLCYALSLFNSIPVLVTSNFRDNGSFFLSTFCYNNIIRAHILLSSPFPALLLFRRMRRRFVPPDFHTFPFALKACSHLRSLSTAQTLHAQAFQLGLSEDLYFQNSLIHVYSILGRLDFARQLIDQSNYNDAVSYNALLDGLVKAGDIAKARHLFNDMPMRDAVSWGTILAGYVREKQYGETVSLFNRMVFSHFKPDNVSIVATLSACTELGELKLGKAIHGYITRRWIRIDAFLATALVDLHVKCGCLEIARDIFESSPEKNLFTWNTMLIGFALHGGGSLVIDLFSRMIDAKIKPDGITFVGVLVACSHAGLVDEARKLFSEMEVVYGVPRELKHYGCMADLLGRTGMVEEAEEMIRRMPLRGDVFVWGGLLGGCCIHGDVMIAKKAAQQVLELKPEDSGVYSALANIYANAERWEEVLDVRSSISKMRVKKNAGSSLI